MTETNFEYRNFRNMKKQISVNLLRALLLMMIIQNGFAAVPREWVEEWPETRFDSATVPLSEIISGGPPRDGIPPIDNPRFMPANEVADVNDSEAVIGLTADGRSKAYPLRVLIWHEIVNDQIGSIPVTVTYCPLCNTSS